METKNTSFLSETFDCIVAYKDVYHLKYYLDDIINESFRISKKGDYLIFISSISIDKNYIDTNYNIISKIENKNSH